MCHAIEQMHPHTEYILRPWCKGGFSYSCLDQVVQGQPLGPDMEMAYSIKELDLTSSYGFSGKSMATCCGFGVSFTPETGRVGQRHFSFEYMATMYTIYKWTVVEKRNILSIFSNFSPLGTLNIGKYPIDLVAIFENGQVEIVQFDGHFVHGDYNNSCLSSTKNQYINFQTREEVEQKTKQRDEATLNWMMKVSQENMKYTIITDCCHVDYSRKKLKQAFSSIPELNQFVKGFEKLNGSLDCIDFNEFTFLAIVEGECAIVPHKLGPIFTTDVSQPTQTRGKMLLTSDYYQYLRVRFGFKIQNVEWIIYYKRCQVLPRVFEKLLQLRQDNAHIKSKSGIVKSIINYACGYFGLNSDKGLKTTARITNRVPKRYNLFLHTLEPIDEISNGMDLLVVKTLKKTPIKKYMCSTPFVLFVGIVEYGKLRLNQALQCLQQFMRPTAMRLLYSNVDNLIIGLAADNFEDALRHPNYTKHFRKAWTQFSGSDPGKLKLEWEMLSDCDWKFVTPARMYYSALALNQQSSYQKTCSFKGLGSERSFEVGLKLLNKEPIQVQQIRRVDKLANTKVKPIICKF